MSGPCLCGDPLCPFCGDPDAFAIEAMHEELLEELLMMHPAQVTAFLMAGRKAARKWEEENEILS